MQQTKRISRIKHVYLRGSHGNSRSKNTSNQHTKRAVMMIIEEAELTPEQLELRNILERDRGSIYRVRSQIVFISKIDIGYRISDGNRSWFSKDIPDNAVKL